MNKARCFGVLALAGGALAALALTSCESTPLTGAEDGELRVSASPQTVVIDQSAGQSQGTSTIAAQMFDEAGRAMIDADVTFVTTSGTLASGGPPNVVRTNSSGIAIDTLTLDVNDDATVTVGAISGKLSADAQITKKLSTGNVPPTAAIVASPQQSQRKGRTVVFDGRTSEDSDGTITCYQWQIDSTDNTRDETVQGATQTTLSRIYPAEQTLTVTLRVSDEPDAATTFCRSGGNPAPPSAFNGVEDFINDYEILCDITGPVASAGTDQVVPGPTAVVTLDASGSDDPDAADTIVNYRWDCGNGQPFQTGTNPTVQCTYSNTTTTAILFTATVIVTNDCGLTDDDRVNVTVRP